MRRGIVAALAAAMLLLIPGSVSATGAKDYAKGSGTIFAGGASELTFALNAWSDPAGNDPDGSIKVDSFGQTFFADVTCLQVLGNTAVVWGDITHRTAGITFFDAIRMTVVDSGDSGIPDEVASTFMFESPPAGLCGPPADALFPLDRGDVTVFDE